jgi:hypothetical protein
MSKTKHTSKPHPNARGINILSTAMLPFVIKNFPQLGELKVNEAIGIIEQCINVQVESDKLKDSIMLTLTHTAETDMFRQAIIHGLSNASLNDLFPSLSDAREIAILRGQMALSVAFTRTVVIKSEEVISRICELWYASDTAVHTLHRILKIREAIGVEYDLNAIWMVIKEHEL